MAPEGGYRDARQLDHAFRDVSSPIPRPRVRCRRPDPGEELRVPGTVVESETGTLVFVGDKPGVVDVEVLAVRLRRARRVELVGDVWTVCQPMKVELRSAWDAAARAARAASRSPVLPRPPVERCARPRADGQPCRRPAGAGADPGESACWQHGGSRALRDAEARRLHEQLQTVVEMAVKGREGPLTLRERLRAAEALHGVLTARTGRRRRTQEDQR